jgi:prepilin-type N-terminal cleavage/methylation domain-containing protein/prepilin-type processing-associated H-X9-DG protein
MKNKYAPRKSGKSRRSGFTLIEILVVLVIIMILAAILFPVFDRAMANAKRASCASNLKQLGLAVQLYTQDYDECMPYGRLRTSASNTPPDGFYGAPPYFWSWSQVTYPYYKDLDLIRCPSQKLGPRNFHQFRHYGANTVLMPLDPNNAGIDPPVTLSSITYPAATYMIMDSGSYYITKANALSTTSGTGVYLPGSEQWASGTPYVTGDLPTYEEKDYKYGRHFQGINIAFADGHVKWLPSHVVFLEAQKAVGDWDLR